MNLDWQRILLNIRQVMPIAKAARILHLNVATINNYARGTASEPKFSNGIAILDLHYKLCPEKHDMAKLGKV